MKIRCLIADDEPLPQKPVVILITAYSEHAVEGFELDVEDYLVKPVTFERFLQAVNKATLQYELKHRVEVPAAQYPAPDPEAGSGGKDYFFVKSGFKSVRINFSVSFSRVFSGLF